MEIKFGNALEVTIYKGLSDRNFDLT
jgi:hypothetical protein